MLSVAEIRFGLRVPVGSVVFLIVPRTFFLEQFRDQEQAGKNRAGREDHIKRRALAHADQSAVEQDTRDKAYNREEQQNLRRLTHISI